MSKIEMAMQALKDAKEFSASSSLDAESTMCSTCSSQCGGNPCIKAPCNPAPRPNPKCGAPPRSIEGE